MRRTLKRNTFTNENETDEFCGNAHARHTHSKIARRDIHAYANSNGPSKAYDDVNATPRGARARPPYFLFQDEIIFRA